MLKRKKAKGYFSEGWNDDTLRYDKRTQSYVSDAVYNAPLKTASGGGKKIGLFGGSKKVSSLLSGLVKVNPPKIIQPVTKTPPVVEPEQQQQAVVKQQAVAKTIYTNPTQITTEYAPFSPSLSEVAPVVIPENPQDEQKSKLSTSGIIGVGLAITAGLL